jgi:hypothetical protein
VHENRYNAVDEPFITNIKFYLLIIVIFAIIAAKMDKIDGVGES